MSGISRRDLLKKSGPLAAGLMTASLTGPARALKAGEGKSRLKLLVAGAHPDDPETGCGGTMARYAENGHEVVALYLTRGEAGIPGKSHDQAAEIRTQEALKACEILNATPVFAGQIDGDTKLDRHFYDELYRVIEKEKPDIVLTHWPVDTHRDHRICSLLLYDAWLRMEKSFALYYFEVMTGSQTQNFNPTDYVDITPVIDVKHKACYQHVSQHIKEEYDNVLLHGDMEIFRGMEGGVKYAEAFIRHVQSRNPGL